MALIGFERMTIRVLDGAAPVTSGAGKNIFVIQGDEGEGATYSAKISGLGDSVVTYGSNKPYHTAIGNIKLELETVDIPEEVLNVVSGFDETVGVVTLGQKLTPPKCAVLLESHSLSEEDALIGFYEGYFTPSDIEMNTLEEKTEELAKDKLTFTAYASTDSATKGKRMVKYLGSESTEIATLKAGLKMTAAV
ncbi:hypothetical protein Hs30E_12900 [Lactococcus hodotermopsidis]|uniref:Phage tail protein n=1 Tax=Pseudolactococcus hodotermopsidis TaxID=2709157 RepID=A0A6A0BBA4_9LACT|nr:major tail protein [Lactococcus hodotermopsidis]GFH42739.1 hypothetical protein Hs30E_12900 [Lactococcus hodotermopsidis]